MTISANVNISAPELCRAIEKLAEAMAANALTPVQEGQIAETQNNLSEQVGAAETKPEAEPAGGEAPAYTLEEVRAKFVALAQANKQVEAKQILTKFGCNKVTAIPENKYPDVVAAVEAALAGGKA